MLQCEKLLCSRLSPQSFLTGSALKQGKISPEEMGSEYISRKFNFLTSCIVNRIASNWWEQFINFSSILHLELWDRIQIRGGIGL